MSRLSLHQKSLRGLGCFLLTILASSCAPAPKPSVNAAPATVAPASGAARGNGIQRTLLARADLAEMPGFESRLYLIEYAPSIEAPLHEHTEQCVGYVLDGRFESAFGEDGSQVVQAGQGFVEQAHAAHRFRNPDSERALRFVVSGTFRKDEPLFQALPSASGPLFTGAATSSEGAPTPAANGSDSLAAIEVKRTLLVQRKIPDMPGLESRIYLIEFPPGKGSPIHVHSSQGIGYVLEGSFESAFGGGPATVRHAGEGFVDLPGQPHHFRNLEAQRWLRFIFAGTFHEGEALFRVVPSAGG